VSAAPRSASGTPHGGVATGAAASSAGGAVAVGGDADAAGGRVSAGRRHLAELERPLRQLGVEAPRIERWGRTLAGVLLAGGRLLTAGNGGSAAEAQHLAGELVGRYRDDRAPFSAIALCAESASFTAIGNDYGADEVFARQVRAHGRAGDVLVVLSTSGCSPNVLAAVGAAAECGIATWALTGAPGNPLALRADDCLAVDSPHTATVQEIHLIAIHLLCEAFDEAVAERSGGRFVRVVG
jgi:D-sedoheptulose 7-phosphate isomerase